MLDYTSLSVTLIHYNILVNLSNSSSDFACSLQTSFLNKVAHFLHNPENVNIEKIVNYTISIQHIMLRN